MQYTVLDAASHYPIPYTLSSAGCHLLTLLRIASAKEIKTVTPCSVWAQHVDKYRDQVAAVRMQSNSRDFAHVAVSVTRACVFE